MPFVPQRRRHAPPDARRCVFDPELQPSLDHTCWTVVDRDSHLHYRASNYLVRSDIRVLHPPRAIGRRHLVVGMVRRFVYIVLLSDLLCMYLYTSDYCTMT